jgi:hypothetical protein
MSGIELFSPVAAVGRFFLSLFRPQAKTPQKKLRAQLMMRGIVSEIPDFLPFYICDETGARHKGLYVVGLLLWNKGSIAITSADFLPASPLTIELAPGAEIISALAVPVEDATLCDITVAGPQKLVITVDCINPGEYIPIPLFIKGDPMATVNVSGRFVGQSEPIDCTADEVKAGWGERFANLFMLCLVLNALPGTIIGGWLIYAKYGLTGFYRNQDVSPFLMAPFGLGLMILLMFVMARLIDKHERRDIPEGYPLRSDLEPPLLENIKGMFRTVFFAKKQRVSTSLFSWGKQIIIPGKRAKRRTIDDWVV